MLISEMVTCFHQKNKKMTGHYGQHKLPSLVQYQKPRNPEIQHVKKGSARAKSALINLDPVWWLHFRTVVPSTRFRGVQLLPALLASLHQSYKMLRIALYICVRITKCTGRQERRSWVAGLQVNQERALYCSSTNLQNRCILIHMVWSSFTGTKITFNHILGSIFYEYEK